LKYNKDMKILRPIMFGWNMQLAKFSLVLYCFSWSQNSWLLCTLRLNSVASNIRAYHPEQLEQ
jgi:hypothetical protein